MAKRIGDIVDGCVQVTAWRGGSKAVAFLGSIGMNDVAVVDIDTHKQGGWLPGVSVEVQAPQALAENEPDVVIAMNPVNVEEIVVDLKAKGLTPELLAL